MPAKLITYECVAKGHEPSLLHPDKLTIHEGEWAFCPFDARSDGHQWQKTGGENLESVTSRLGPTNLAAGKEESHPAS